MQRSLRDLDTRLLRQVTSDIREVIQNFAKETKTNIVMDSSTLAYADPELDVTDEILKRMGVDPKKRHEAKKIGRKGSETGKK